MVLPNHELLFSLHKTLLAYDFIIGFTILVPPLPKPRHEELGASGLDHHWTVAGLKGITGQQLGLHV
jgi:hypothetical protein